MELFQSISNMLLSSRSCRIVQHKAGCQHQALLQLSRQKFNINKNNWKWKLGGGGKGGKGARQTNRQMPVLRKKTLKKTSILGKKGVYPLLNAQCKETAQNRACPSTARNWECQEDLRSRCSSDELFHRLINWPHVFRRQVLNHQRDWKRSLHESKNKINSKFSHSSFNKEHVARKANCFKVKINY